MVREYRVSEYTQKILDHYALSDRWQLISLYRYVLTRWGICQEAVVWKEWTEAKERFFKREQIKAGYVDEQQEE